MGEFSAALKLTGLDDFITPSQACTKPVQMVPAKKQKTETAEGDSSGATSKKGAPKIVLDDEGGLLEVGMDGSEQKLEPATITLNDCLACSGCITSAESVLISQQSKEEFYQNLPTSLSAPTDRTIVVSISPQSRASLAAYFRLDVRQTMKKLVTFFKSLGVHYVFDTSFSREFSILETCAEFISRYRASRQQSDDDAGGSSSQLPMLTSACPGWVCYAEKTQGFVLPYISTAKSPQQVMGTVVKKYFARQKLGASGEKVYHVAIMPCYDKKLEASRDDFFDQEIGTREVDCVITSKEVLEMINDKGTDFSALPESPLDRSLFTNIAEDDEVLLGVRGGSGGYLDCVFRYAARELFGVQVKGPLKYTARRNVDFQETFLEVDGKVVLRFALAYGFRNIQNLVRQIKQQSPSAKKPTASGRRIVAGRASSERYDFVEVMACPSGCLNGGGQIPVSMQIGGAESAKEFLKRTEEAYNNEICTRESLPIETTHPLVSQLYATWVQGAPFSETARRLLHTQYYQRENLNLLPATSTQW